MTISNELLDELLKGCARPEDLPGEAGLMKELKLRLMERMLGGELTAHLGYAAGAEPPSRSGQPAQWRDDEAGEGAGWRDALGRSPGPGWQFRARTGQEAADPD